MAVSRTQISILSIYFTIGFMANNVCGECYRPNFKNPYAILLNPDQSIYNDYYPIDLSCKEAHTKSGLPDRTYCQNPGEDMPWDPDPSDGRCEAQCNTTELLDDDIFVTVNGTQQTLVDSQSTGDFSCRVPGQYAGVTSSVCTNGTFDYTTEPSCLGYCPIYLEDLEKGLLYDGGPDTPVLTNSTVEYYEDQATIIYQCEDGYYDLNCSVHGLPDDCTTTCVDGTWTPSQIPTCIDIDECLSDPCQNSATCTDLIDKYECECTDGFDGTHCEINIDDCANHTCQNGATCIDKVAAYKCQCPDGYDGTHCENVLTTSAMTTIIMTTDNTTSPGSTFEPVLTTTDQDMTTSELTTAMPPSTTMMTDQTTMAVTSSKAVTTDKMTTLLGTTLPSTTLTTSTDSSTTSVTVVTTGTPAAATTIFLEATTVTPEATPVTSDMATISKGVTASPVPASTTESDSNTTSVMTTKTVGTTDTPTAATNITSDATTVTPDATTVTSSMATITKGATAPTVPASTTESDSNTTSVMTTEVVATTDTPAAATTAITAATTVTPDATTNTADATTVSPGMTTISKETTAKSTKSPTTTPLPCGGECLPTEVCNAMDQCECRPDYYFDEVEEDCKEPTSIDVTITITAVNGTDPEYKEEYRDPESEEFKSLEKDVCQPFNEIYSNDNEYEGCRVIEFTEGSIIVNYVLTFVQNSTISVSHVNETVYQELQNPNGSFSGDLTFDDSSLSVAPLNQCDKGLDDCHMNATCEDQGEDGYTCECKEGFTDVGNPKYVLPGRECTELPTTELPRITTEEPKEPGMEVWKVVVGVTVPIVGILTITIVGLVCWQYRRLDRTSPVSESTKLRTRPYQEDIGDSDRDASRPGSMMIMNNDGTVQEVVLPWRNDASEGEFIFAPDIDSKGKNQMLPMVDYPSNYGPSSYDNDPLGNIVSSYDNYTYQNHDTRNTTEIDSRYF